jgi:hypothetical protein
MSFLSGLFADSTFTHGALGCAAFAFICWLGSVITREYSWVDRCGSEIRSAFRRGRSVGEREGGGAPSHSGNNRLLGLGPERRNGFPDDDLHG